MDRLPARDGSFSSVRSSEPARVVRTEIVESSGDEAGVLTVGLHQPERGRSSRFRAAERDEPAVRRFARAEIPDRRVAPRQDGDTPVARVKPADLGAAAGELGLEVAVEVVDVGAPRLVFPGDPGTRQAAREEDEAVA